MRIWLICYFTMGNFFTVIFDFRSRFILSDGDHQTIKTTVCVSIFNIRSISLFKTKYHDTEC